MGYGFYFPILILTHENRNPLFFLTNPNPFRQCTLCDWIIPYASTKTLQEKLPDP
jgi:hypothetical protein